MTWLANIFSPRFLIALLVLAMFAGSIIVMSFFNVPESNQEVVIQLIGGINTLAGLVVGYYFGSTARTDDGAIPVTVENTPDDPANVKNNNEGEYP